MQTLHYIANPDKRKRIALETVEIYAPLAERMGIHRMKDELEDLAFAELHKDARDSIVQRLQFLREQGGDIVGRVIDELKKVLNEDGVKAAVSGSEKQPHSIRSEEGREGKGCVCRCRSRWTPYTLNKKARHTKQTKQ